MALPEERWLWAGVLAGLHALVAVAWVGGVEAASARLPWTRRAAPVLPLVLLLVWATRLPGGAPRPGAPERSADGPTVLLVTIDTLRADQLDPDRMPALHRLARQGATWSRAYSTAPLTAPAHASLLTGADVWEHGLVSNGRSVELDSVVPRLHAAGYRTGAFLSARVLDRSTGLHVGFEHFDDRWGDARLSWLPGGPSGEVVRRGHETLDRFERWRATLDGPWFAWVHLYDPHTPYDPPGSFRPTDQQLQGAEEEVEPEHPAKLSTLFRRLATGAPHEQRLLYEGEVRWTDRLLQRLLGQVPDDAVVLVVGDHGESLGENGYWFNHGARLWEATIRVPLVLRWPGVVAPDSRSDELVSIQDVAATLATVAEGGEAPLIRSLGGPTREVVTSYTTGQEARATLGYRDEHAGPWRRGPVASRIFEDGKLMVFRGEEAVWFDLEHDPEESIPLPVPPHRAADATALEAMVEQRATPLSDEQRAHLEALGYVH